MTKKVPGRGDQFGRWLVVASECVMIKGQRHIECMCICGFKKVVSIYSLRGNGTKGCTDCAAKDRRIEKRGGDIGSVLSAISELSAKVDVFMEEVSAMNELLGEEGDSQKKEEASVNSVVVEEVAHKKKEFIPATTDFKIRGD